MKHPKSVRDYFARIGAEVLNFRRAMVKSYKSHYYIERALIKISSDGTVTSSVKEFAPTAEEAAAMKAELAGVEFPRTIKARNTDDLNVKGEIFEFWDLAREEIIMVQERRTTNGVKKYVPWVFLSTGEWAMMEPDGALPFWKPRQGRGPGGRIMIHEGAKAAAAAANLNEDHPWAEELAEYEHWGMVGGALAPHRTDYQELKDMAPKEVVYICDNDRPGEQALQKVSQYWGKSLRGAKFGKKFPPSWDLADPMPKELFTRSGRYVGPRLADLIEAATWATEVVPPPDGKGRPTTVLRSEFAEEWLHCITPEVFVHKDWPNRILNAGEFNSRVAPFSHVDDTARLVRKDFASKAAVLRFMPGEEPGIHGGSTAGQYINTYCGSNIKSEEGDPAPFLDFMEHLCPGEKDREELMRWCATLIAKPATRMLYGALLISEMQGIGKGTLGEKILAPLVGETNVSYPSEQEIVDSQFNYWLAHKRLAVVHEIYAGQSSKAYNKLKSAITDRYVTVQKKYQANYEIENWIHVFACSNSLRAIKLSMDDRRWFVPKITDEKRQAAYWEGLNQWLMEEGGLGIIRWWAEEWIKEHGAVETGSAAPWSELKKQIVEEGYSPGQALVANTLDAIKRQVEAGELPPDTFVIDMQLIELIRNQLWEGRHNDRLERPATVRTVAKSCGWSAGETRAQVKEWGPSVMGGRILALDPNVAAKVPSELGGERVKESARKRPLDLNAVTGM